MWVRHEVRITPPPKDIMQEKIVTVLWNKGRGKKAHSHGQILLGEYPTPPSPPWRNFSVVPLPY